MDDPWGNPQALPPDWGAQLEPVPEAERQAGIAFINGLERAADQARAFCILRDFGGLADLLCARDKRIQALDAECRELRAELEVARRAAAAARARTTMRISFDRDDAGTIIGALAEPVRGRR